MDKGGGKGVAGGAQYVASEWCSLTCRQLLQHQSFAAAHFCRMVRVTICACNSDPGCAGSHDVATRVARTVKDLDTVNSRLGESKQYSECVT